jgi:hypothetical protein
MKIFKLIEKMNPFVQAGDWHGLESTYRQIAAQAVGEEQAIKIAAVALKTYQRRLAKAIGRAVKKASAVKAQAVYFEYDMDNDWQGTFFICIDYSPQELGDDDWAGDWSEDFSGPSLPEFCALYRKHGFAKDAQAVGSTCYLIARTLAAFGRSAEAFQTDGIALCIAFHDQDPIMRIREIS